MFNIDGMTWAYLLVVAANLALIFLVGNLAYERARNAWVIVFNSAHHLRENEARFVSATENAAAATAETEKKIEQARAELAEAEARLAEIKRKHLKEPLPFAYRITPTQNLDPGGAVWEFVVHQDEEPRREPDPHHPARQWSNGRLYMVQAATQVAAKRQIERLLPEDEGYRITLVKRHGDIAFAEAG